MTQIQKNMAHAGSTFNGLFIILVASIAVFLTSCRNLEQWSASPYDTSLDIAPASSEASSLGLEQLKSEVQKWEAWENYEMIYGLLEKSINASFSPELCSYVLDYSQMHLMRLQRKAYCHEQSAFSKRTNYGKKKSKEMARDEHFNLLSKDEARNIAFQFELQKQCLQRCRRQFISTYQPVDSDETRNEYQKLWTRSETLKKELIHARCNFISNGVLSPYLAETEKWLFLAKGEWYRLWLSHSNELYKAVDYIATPAHKEWLFESNDEVREQFIRTWREMKRLASKREWEEFQVIVTLKESFDPSKNVGAEAWWNK